MDRVSGHASVGHSSRAQRCHRLRFREGRSAGGAVWISRIICGGSQYADHRAKSVDAPAGRWRSLSSERVEQGNGAHFPGAVVRNTVAEEKMEGPFARDGARPFCGGRLSYPSTPGAGPEATAPASP